MSTQLPESREAVLEALQRSLQTAIELEFSTIPLYTTVLASLSSDEAPLAPPSKTFVAFVTIAYEEMLHMALASNILLAIGGAPAVKGTHAPRYSRPSPLPGHDQMKDPFTVSLDQLSKEAIVTFLQIELPELNDSPPQAWNRWDTIGQFYRGIEALIKSPSLTDDDFRARAQMTDPRSMFPRFSHGSWFEVRDKESALRALNEIVVQGEGTRHDHRDGQPGHELAHYFRLRAIYRDMGGTREGIGPRTSAERAEYLRSFDDAVYEKWKAANIKRNLVKDPDVNRPEPTAKATVSVGGQEVEMTAQQAEAWFTANYSQVLDELESGMNHSPPAIGEAISAMSNLDPPLNACTSFTVEIDGESYVWSPTFAYKATSD